MKIKVLYLLLSLGILHSKGVAQLIPQGLFSEKPVHPYSPIFILEFTGNKFYMYYLPGGMESILIKTGTYTISDTTVALKTDTTALFSLNINRLAYMRINCDSLQYMKFNAEESTFTFFEESVIHSLNRMIRLNQTTESEIVKALKRFGGITLDQVRPYVVPPAGFEIKVCDE